MQGDSARDANQAAPGARADDGADFLTMEEPRESVAAGTGELVDDHYFWPVDRHGRPGDIFSFARGKGGEQFALEFFGVKIRNLPAGVVALVDNDAVLVELRGELLVERDDAGERGVRHVHIADAAAGRFRDFAPVFVHPSEITRTGITGRRSPADSPRAFGRGFGIDFQRDEFSGEVLEIRVDVLIRTRFLA